MMQTTYLTGGTGFLGSHFVRNYLSRRQFRVRCFVRGDCDEACTLRIRQAVHTATASYPGGRALNLDGVAGIRSDITLPHLGLNEAWLDAPNDKPVGSTFFHFASSLNFEEKNREAIYNHNINGLRNAVEVAARLRCAVFFYVSTAYTAGMQDGVVREHLHRPAAFNNYYEETKCAAEHLVMELCGARGMRAVIIRPSVVIGPSKSCKTGGSTTGLYGLIRDIYRLKRHLRQLNVPVVVYLNPDAGVNFIPVDYVCHDIFRLFEDPNITSGVHHATADNNVNIRVLVKLIAQHLDLPDFTLERLDLFDIDRALPIEKLLVRTMAYYNSITRTTKQFERNRGPSWTLRIDEVERYVIEAVRGIQLVKSDSPNRREVLFNEAQ